MNSDIHETFVKNLVSNKTAHEDHSDGCSSPLGMSIENIDEKRKREEEELMFFTEELAQAYSKIFRFLKDTLTVEEYA